MLIKEKARIDAAEVLDTCWAADFPVDPERIAHSLGMVVYRLPLESGVSGILRVEPGDDPEIFVNNTDSPLRQTFTIAHEIGHYIERTDRDEVDFNIIERRGMDYDLHEFYADEFAGNLLMPEDEVKKLHARSSSIVSMARHFGVSLRAVQKRLQRLGLRRA